MQLALAILVGAVTLASVPVAGARSLGARLNINPIQARTESFPLDARQAPTPNIPPQCQDACSPVVAIDTCTPSACCTASYEQQLFDCFACLVPAGGSSNYTIAQSTVDALYVACAGEGLSLPILTFPGEDPGRPLSSISGSASSTSQSTTGAQSTITSLSTPLSTTTRPTISQSTVTSLAPTTALPNVTATSSSASNSAGKMEGGVDLHILLMMIGSLVAGSLLVLS